MSLCKDKKHVCVSTKRARFCKEQTGALIKKQRQAMNPDEVMLYQGRESKVLEGIGRCSEQQP